MKLKTTIKGHTNPFEIEDGRTLVNIVTEAIVPDDIAKDIISIPEKGHEMYKVYVRERFEGQTSLWAPLKRS